MVKVGVLGYGTVGSGVVEILEKNKDIIAKRVGQEISAGFSGRPGGKGTGTRF